MENIKEQFARLYMELDLTDDQAAMIKKLQSDVDAALRQPTVIKNNNMEYQKYIDLGFERTELNCGVEFKQTGYYGFALEKKLNDKIMVCVTSGDLDKPKLYIKKRNSETYHIIPISTETVIDLLSNSENFDYMNTAC